MYAFYVARGHGLDELVNLSNIEKIFMQQAMMNYYEIENKKLGG